MGLRDYVIATTDGSVATTKIAMAELGKARFAATWLATQESYTDRHRKTHMLETSVFPGYLFVAFDPDDHRWRSIVAMRGVKRFLGVDPLRPQALPHGAIDRLKAQFQAGEFKLKPMARIALGDKVVFEAGPFQGHTGTVTLSKGERVKVLMSLFGCEREVPVRMDMVRAAE